jgi:hypothetical protein
MDHQAPTSTSHQEDLIFPQPFLHHDTYHHHHSNLSQQPVTPSLEQIIASRSVQPACVGIDKYCSTVLLYENCQKKPARTSIKAQSKQFTSPMPMCQPQHLICLPNFVFERPTTMLRSGYTLCDSQSTIVLGGL